MPLKINVPYSEKDLAKEKGACWDKENETWFVPDNKDINQFSRWIDTNVSLIAKAPFWLGVTQKSCWKCDNPIEVIAFASNNFLEFDEDNEQQGWLPQKCFSFFSMPSYIEKEVLDIVCSRYPFFQQGFSKTINGTYLANHCKFCGALQGDFYMHDEPGGEFCPIDINGYEAITLIEIPYKFDLMIDAASSLASNADDILKHCRKSKW